MEPAAPAPWTYAARAAYFGDLVCSFCQHHNPAGAQFCNGCGSPLHLKPCCRCDAVNHQAATNCYKCGAEYPALFATPEATSVSPTTDSPVRRPLFAGSTLRMCWRVLDSDRLLLPVVATILIGGAYAVYRINAPNSDTIRTAPVVPLAAESKPVQPDMTADLQAPISVTHSEPSEHASAPHRREAASAPKRANAPHRAPAAPAKDASASQRSLPELPVQVQSFSGGVPNDHGK